MVLIRKTKKSCLEFTRQSPCYRQDMIQLDSNLLRSTAISACLLRRSPRFWNRWDARAFASKNRIEAERTNKIRSHAALESERQIPEVPENRHFENLESLNVRNRVSPFGIAVVVPHLPENTAYQCRQSRQRQSVPFSPLQLLQDGFFAEQHLH